MKNFRLGEVEARFADLIWANAPLTTGELVKLCQEKLQWKRTTTYTVLKRLCDREIFETRDSMVTAKASRKEFYACQSEEFVEESFGGSLPAFLAAFTARKKLSRSEVEEIRKMIDAYGKEG